MRPPTTRDRPSVTELLALTLWVTRTVREADAWWAQTCRERGIRAPAGDSLIDRQELPAAIWLRLPAGAVPEGNRQAGPRAALCGRLAVVFARTPGVVEAAAKQFRGERAECRLAEAGIAAGEGRLGR